MPFSDWIVHNEGRDWKKEEVWERWQRSPEKIELIEGKVFWSEEDRINMLGLLLEQVGADRAVQFGDPDVWRRAVAKLGA